MRSNHVEPRGNHRAHLRKRQSDDLEDPWRHGCGSAPISGVPPWFVTNRAWLERYPGLGYGTPLGLFSFVDLGILGVSRGDTRRQEAGAR